MAETATSQGVIDSLIGMGEQFASVATGSPEQAALLALGALITLFSMAVFGALALGGVFGAIKHWLPSGSRPPQAR